MFPGRELSKDEESVLEAGGIGTPLAPDTQSTASLVPSPRTRKRRVKSWSDRILKSVSISLGKISLGRTKDSPGSSPGDVLYRSFEASSFDDVSTRNSGGLQPRPKSMDEATLAGVSSFKKPLVSLRSIMKITKDSSFGRSSALTESFTCSNSASPHDYFTQITSGRRSSLPVEGTDREPVKEAVYLPVKRKTSEDSVFCEVDLPEIKSGSKSAPPSRLAMHEIYERDTHLRFRSSIRDHFEINVGCSTSGSNVRNPQLTVQGPDGRPMSVSQDSSPERRGNSAGENTAVTNQSTTPKDKKTMNLQKKIKSSPTLITTETIERNCFRAALTEHLRTAPHFLTVSNGVQYMPSQSLTEPKPSDRPARSVNDSFTGFN